MTTPLVLLVDDDQLLLAMLQRWLASAGLATVTASTTPEALRSSARHAGQIVAAVIDLYLPGPMGDELLRSLRSVRPDLPVVGISGRDPTEAFERLSAAGAGAWLHKPFTGQQLVHALAKVSPRIASYVRSTQAAADPTD